ncbi:hypothetical protein E2P86_03800 [Sphingobacterium psychroaquaticum]|nr:hypothetical protein [Sphingobacterium psychroaquaticum]QBQ40318.1 hypothetical protein E2P86_03800 [Sphingobacterium psychroaquaticum]
MKTLSAILFVLLFQTTFTFSQQKTEIYIIGNIHDSVPNYHPQILFNILDKVKPDIILHEVDSKGMEEYIKEANPKGNEIKASNQYVQKYPNTKRLPFDFEGRNQYRKDLGMVPTDNLTFRLIDKLYKEEKLSPTESKIYEEFSQLTNRLMKIAEGPPEQFNNSKTDKIAKERQTAQYHRGLLKIVNQRTEFKENYVTKPNQETISYQDGYALMCDFWDTRNKTMAKNIFDIANTHKGQTIVVLTGFLHRYYLIEQLKKLNKGSYTIKEFYQL